MRIPQLLVPIAQIACLTESDTVREAFDRLESCELYAAPILDAQGRYVATVTEADLRRHVAAHPDRILAFATPVSKVPRRTVNTPVVERELPAASRSERLAGHAFIPVVDDTGRLVGVVERSQFPAAA